MPCSRELRLPSPPRTETNCGVSVAMRPCQRGDDHGLCSRIASATDLTLDGPPSPPLPLPRLEQRCNLRSLAHFARLTLRLLRHSSARMLMESSHLSAPR